MFDIISEVCIILFQKTQKFDNVIKVSFFPREKNEFTLTGGGGGGSKNWHSVNK